MNPIHAFFGIALAIIFGVYLVWTLSWSTLFILFLCGWFVCARLYKWRNAPAKPVRVYQEMSDQDMKSFMGM